MSVRELERFPAVVFVGATVNLKWPFDREEDVKVFKEEIIIDDLGIKKYILAELPRSNFEVLKRDVIIGGIYGTVDMKVIPQPSPGTQIKLFAVRDTERDQDVDFRRISINSNSYSDVLNAALDKLTMAIQELTNTSLRLSLENLMDGVNATLPPVEGGGAIVAREDGKGFEFRKVAGDQVNADWTASLPSKAAILNKPKLAGVDDYSAISSTETADKINLDVKIDDFTIRKNAQNKLYASSGLTPVAIRADAGEDDVHAESYIERNPRKYAFNSQFERDSYFENNPTELVLGLQIAMLNQDSRTFTIQRWDGREGENIRLDELQPNVNISGGKITFTGNENFPDPTGVINQKQLFDAAIDDDFSNLVLNVSPDGWNGQDFSWITNPVRIIEFENGDYIGLLRDPNTQIVKYCLFDTTDVPKNTLGVLNNQNWDFSAIKLGNEGYTVTRNQIVEPNHGWNEDTVQLFKHTNVILGQKTAWLIKAKQGGLENGLGLFLNFDENLNPIFVISGNHSEKKPVAKWTGASWQYNNLIVNISSNTFSDETDNDYEGICEFQNKVYLEIDQKSFEWIDLGGAGDVLWELKEGILQPTDGIYNFCISSDEGTGGSFSKFSLNKELFRLENYSVTVSSVADLNTGMDISGDSLTSYGIETSSFVPTQEESEIITFKNGAKINIAQYEMGKWAILLSSDTDIHLAEYFDNKWKQLGEVKLGDGYTVDHQGILPDTEIYELMKCIQYRFFANFSFFGLDNNSVYLGRNSERQEIATRNEIPQTLPGSSISIIDGKLDVKVDGDTIVKASDGTLTAVAGGEYTAKEPLVVESDKKIELVFDETLGVTTQKQLTVKNASKTQRGIIQVGDRLSITDGGVLSADAQIGATTFWFATPQARDDYFALDQNKDKLVDGILAAIPDPVAQTSQGDAIVAAQASLSRYTKIDASAGSWVLMGSGTSLDSYWEYNQNEDVLRNINTTAIFRARSVHSAIPEVIATQMKMELKDGVALLGGVAEDSDSENISDIQCNVVLANGVRGISIHNYSISKEKTETKPFSSLNHGDDISNKKITFTDVTGPAPTNDDVLFFIFDGDSSPKLMIKAGPSESSALLCFRDLPGGLVQNIATYDSSQERWLGEPNISPLVNGVVNSKEDFGNYAFLMENLKYEEVEPATQQKSRLLLAGENAYLAKSDNIADILQIATVDMLGDQFWEDRGGILSNKDASQSVYFSSTTGSSSGNDVIASCSLSNGLATLNMNQRTQVGDKFTFSNASIKSGLINGEMGVEFELIKKEDETHLNISTKIRLSETYAQISALNQNSLTGVSLKVNGEAGQIVKTVGGVSTQENIATEFLAKDRPMKLFHVKQFDDLTGGKITMNAGNYGAFDNDQTIVIEFQNGDVIKKFQNEIVFLNSYESTYEAIGEIDGNGNWTPSGSEIILRNGCIVASNYISNLPQYFQLLFQNIFVTLAEQRITIEWLYNHLI